MCNVLTKTGCTSVSSWGSITVILIPADYGETLHFQVDGLVLDSKVICPLCNYELLSQLQATALHHKYLLSYGLCLRTIKTCPMLIMRK